MALDPAVAKLLAERQRHLAAGDRLGDSGSSLLPLSVRDLRSFRRPRWLHSNQRLQLVEWTKTAERIPDEQDAVCDIVVSTVALSLSISVCWFSFVVG